MNSPTLTLTEELIRRRSVTPDDAGCLDLIGARLEVLGFHLERLRFGDVDNLWATRGESAEVFTFAGHTDVVPSGDPATWRSDPFLPEVRGGLLYGRGAADMKGSLAAMVTATERFVTAHPDHAATLSFLLTSDEEGIATDGTVKVIETLRARGQPITWCLVGEPSSRDTLGDLVRNGRRGSLNGKLTVHGIQGHVAYPDLAANPIHLVAPTLATLANMTWDEGNAFYPPTSFQISNIAAGTGAENVIPGELTARFNFRFCTESTVKSLIERTTAILDGAAIDYELDWHVSGQPFLTAGGALLDAVRESIRDTLGVTVEASTGGGTSDGRFIAPIGAEVVELGPINATIHKVDECVSVADLDRLSATYERILERLVAGKKNPGS